MATQEQIESFYRFATAQLATGDVDKTVDELYDLWRCEHLTSAELAENVAAIQASIDDMKNGEKGRDATEVIRELRTEMKLPAPE